MRLVSKFKDYYDGLQGMDREPKPAYIRMRDTEFISNKDKARISELGLTRVVEAFREMPKSELGFSRALIGFCGKFYPLYLREIGCAKKQVNRGHIKWVHDHRAFRTPDEVLAAVEAEPKPEFNNDILSWRQRQRHAKSLRKSNGSHDILRGAIFTMSGWDWWHKVKDGQVLKGRHDDVFRALDVPLLRIRINVNAHPNTGIEIERNPELKSLGFASVVEPFLAWQEIDQYLGNQLARQEDPADLPDELRRDAHGFDGRSFKQNAPGERKARRKARKVKEKA